MLFRSQTVTRLTIPAIEKVGFKVWAPPFLKQLGVEGGTPLAIGLANKWFQVIKNKTGKTFTPEEINSVKEALGSLSDADKLLFWAENISNEQGAISEKNIESAPAMVNLVKEYYGKGNKPNPESDKIWDDYFNKTENKEKLKKDSTTQEPY